MREQHEKILMAISTICLGLLLFGFLFLIVTGKTISIRGNEFGIQNVRTLFNSVPLFHATSSSVQPISNTGDVNTIFFGGRILTNPDSWSYRKTTKYTCPSIEFYMPQGMEEKRIMTVMDKTFCDPKGASVPMTLQIIPRANLLFYIHTEDEAYAEMMELMMQTVQ